MTDWLQILQQDYVKKSEVRIVNDRLRFRMLPDVAKNYDNGMYSAAAAMWSGLVQEISALTVKYNRDSQPIFYIYFLPDDFYETVQGLETIIGKPITSFDKDGFVLALGYLQQTLGDATQNNKDDLFNRVIKLHELSHLICAEFGQRSGVCSEGFAELVPWYILGYEKHIPTHLKWMRALPKIYTLQDFYDNSVPYFEKLGPKIASYRSGYVSLYLIWRAIVSNVADLFKISPNQAVQKVLNLWYDKRCIPNRDFFVQLAQFAGMDTDKLFYTTEYQQAVLDDIARDTAKSQQIQQGRTI